MAVEDLNNDCSKVTVFPQGFKNRKGKPQRHDTYVVRRQADETGVCIGGVTYGFDHKYELVPGKWKFEIWSGGKNLLEKEFTVHKPA